MKNRRCATCVWWESSNIKQGMCRLNPPKADAERHDRGVWPSTFDYDWCGSWGMKPEAIRVIQDAMKAKQPEPDECL